MKSAPSSWLVREGRWLYSVRISHHIAGWVVTKHKADQQHNISVSFSSTINTYLLDMYVVLQYCCLFLYPKLKMKIRFQSNHSLPCIHICLVWQVLVLHRSIFYCFCSLSFTRQDLAVISFIEKCFKNTIDLLLFYGEHFYGFSESVLL